ncbi:MAG TPA: sulfite exporter TauE/SafE family protein [Deltaproteobacteria bacterium]|nr:sulfite exporter TauE/SafE family protein [Deltaproteobacteria bacterium]
MTEVVLLAVLTLAASAVGTATGFGISTIMIPVLAVFLPMPVTLLFVGIIHLFGAVWMMLLFRKGIHWKLILGFGLSGIIASYIGAALTFQVQGLPLQRILGLFLVLYVAFLFANPRWALPENNGTAVAGGILSGLSAGFFGVGGAVRGAFLTAFDLPRDAYLFTSGIIAFFIDITRISRYFLGGVNLGRDLTAALIVCIPASFIGARLARKFLDRLPQSRFRMFVGVFLFLVALRLILF